MMTPILLTKLYAPPHRPNGVVRTRLLERLEQGLHRKLTLISAPAGFGKTTLVSAWRQKAEGGRQKEEGRKRIVDEDSSSFILHPSSFGWLSLDEGDGEPVRFLRYLVRALQTAVSPLAPAILHALQTPQPPAVDLLLAELVNEIAQLEQKIVLVLDDYHRIDAPAVDEMLRFLVAQMPPQLHLVLTTREDPPLPLARLRAQDQLTEIRAADLRFTVGETAVFFQNSTGLTLTPANIAALEARTEGWVAGLQMAALALQTPPAARDGLDAGQFIDAFHGRHRFVLDYLVDEVLKRQTVEVREFLLKTAVLQRLHASLCEAVTGLPHSDQLLTTLEQENLFIVPLDDQRQWYRYHHLFAEMLHAHLQAEMGQTVASLHLKASVWYEQNLLLQDAIQHALHAEAFGRVADLLEAAWPDMDRSFQFRPWLRWARQLPEPLLESRPVLCMNVAFAYLQLGEFQTAARYRQHVAAWVDAGAVIPKSTANQAQYAPLPARLATAEAYVAVSMQDVPRTVQAAERALTLLPDEKSLDRILPLALLGLAHWRQGALEDAYRAMAAARDNFRHADHFVYAVSPTLLLAEIRMLQGRLRDADGLLQEALQTAEAEAGHVFSSLGELHIGLGSLALERGLVETAVFHLETVEKMGKVSLVQGGEVSLRAFAAKCKTAVGQYDDALRLLDEAAAAYHESIMPAARPLSARKARLLIRLGRLREAEHWLDEAQITIDDAPSFLREYEQATLARYYLAQAQLGNPLIGEDALLGFIARLHAFAAAGGRRVHVVELLLLQAMAQQQAGHSAQIMHALTQAIQLAQPEEMVRPFVVEVTAVSPLLHQLKADRASFSQLTQVEAAFVVRLLALLDEGGGKRPFSSDAQIDPLSQRELEVLQLIADGLSNRQIAERLFLALSTIKGHNRLIFDKLHVRRRTEAVARARELGLLP